MRRRTPAADLAPDRSDMRRFQSVIAVHVTPSGRYQTQDSLSGKRQTFGPFPTVATGDKLSHAAAEAVRKLYGEDFSLTSAGEIHGEKVWIATGYRLNLEALKRSLSQNPATQTEGN